MPDRTAVTSHVHGTGRPTRFRPRSAGRQPRPERLPSDRHEEGLRVMRRTIGVVSLLAALLALPSATLATNPGPPNVEVTPPQVIVDDRGEVGVSFDPGLILFTYADGTETSCVLDPAVPPNPCTELASTPGPPDVEVVPPEATFGDDGALLGFVAGYVLITFGDGTQQACVLDPMLPPNPCAEVTR